MKKSNIAFLFQKHEAKKIATSAPPKSICASFGPIYVRFEPFNCNITVWLIYSHFMELFLSILLYCT
jgi:hypothetical protein